MGKYIHLYDTDSEFKEDYMGSKYNEPWVSYTRETQKVKYNKDEYERLLETPLTFEILSGGVISWSMESGMLGKEIQYRVNDGEWISIVASTPEARIAVVSGDNVQFRGDNATYYDEEESESCTFRLTDCRFNVKGNIMSLINSTDFKTLDTLASSYTFNWLFTECPELISAEKLILPATTLAEFCYANMFDSCPSLVKAPALPATTLAEECYSSMFNSCTSLLTAPALPATTLASYCYAYMFEYCTSLLTAPALPATTLANWCYEGMFDNCSLLTTAPALPAATLTEGCYSRMFYGCTSLNYIKCLATDITETSCTNIWVSNVSSSGTFVKNASMTAWRTGSNGIPNGWTVEDAA